MRNRARSNLAEIADPAELCPPEVGRVVSRVGVYRGDASRLAIHVGETRVAIISIRDADLVAVGDAWTGDLAQRLYDAARSLAALRHALRLLSSRARSRRQLSDTLRQRGHHPPMIERALDRLEELGLIDDRALAQTRAAGLAARGQHGTRAIELKLRQIGISSETARASASEASRDVDQRQSATDLARRRVSRQAPGLDPQKARRRLFAFLTRRGFSYDDARAAVESALNDPAETT